MKKMLTRRPWTASLAVGVLAAVAPVLAAPAALAQTHYKVQQQWKIGGDGGWDYLALDPASHLIYIARDNRVLMVDPSKGKQTGEIDGFKHTHDIVFDAKNKYGYISDGGSDQVAVFDRASGKVIKTIPAGKDPDGEVYEPVTKTAWAFNGHSDSATAIDTKTNQVIATVALPGKPEFPVADGRGTIFDNIENKSEIVRINAKTHKVTAVWPLAPCESPSGLAIDTAHRRLFAVCDNQKMAIVNADTGKVIATPTIGDGPDAARFDAKKQLAFSSNGDGTLTVVHEDSPNKFTVVQNVPTKRGARTIEIDPSTGKIYLITAEFGPKPAPTAEHPHPRPAILPGTFEVIVVGE